jgi:uncharacterized membrane protein YraQ (UPF0718 family)
MFAAVIGGIFLLIYRSFLTLSAFQVFATVIVAMVLEAVPFLLIGAIASSIIRSVVPLGFFSRLSRRLGVFGIPVVALSGVVAPICECAIVPTVARLKERGLPTGYAVTMLLSVPLLNPVVLASTLAAFPGRGDIVAARFGIGAIVAVSVGLITYGYEAVRRGRNSKRETTVVPRITTEPIGAIRRFDLLNVIHQSVEEFFEIFGYFLVGVIVSSLVTTAFSPELYTSVSQKPIISIVTMIAAAFVLSVCSEADAFIGKALLPVVGPMGVTAFLVFGPMLDLKNTAMLGRVFPVRGIVALGGLLFIFVSIGVLVVGGVLF